VAVACLPFFFMGNRLDRWEGAVFLGYYIAYTTYLVLDAWHHTALNDFVSAMVGFVMPLTLLTLGVMLFRYLSRQRRSAGS